MSPPSLLYKALMKRTTRFSFLLIVFLISDNIQSQFQQLVMLQLKQMRYTLTDIRLKEPFLVFAQNSCQLLINSKKWLSCDTVMYNIDIYYIKKGQLLN